MKVKGWAVAGVAALLTGSAGCSPGGNELDFGTRTFSMCAPQVDGLPTVFDGGVFTVRAGGEIELQSVEAIESANLQIIGIALLPQDAPAVATANLDADTKDLLRWDERLFSGGRSYSAGQWLVQVALASTTSGKSRGELAGLRYSYRTGSGPVRTQEDTSLHLYLPGPEETCADVIEEVSR